MSTQLVLNKYNTNYEALRSAETQTMFNGSFLRVCRILWFVKKLDFAFLSLADQAMVPEFSVSAECQSIGTIGKK